MAAHLAVKVSDTTLSATSRDGAWLLPSVDASQRPSYLSEDLLSPPPSFQQRLAPGSGPSTPDLSGSDTPLFEPSPDFHGLGTPGIEGAVVGGWRPAWLRRRVLGGFLGGFGALAVVAEALVHVMARREADAGLRGLWTFGPVLVVSLVAALWGRVESQAMQYTPWIVLARHSSSVGMTEAARTVLLDYPGMNLLVALFTAARYRHMLVVSSTLVTLLLRSQMVLSAALFSIDTAADGTQRLSLRSGILHAMAALLATSAVLLLWMLYHAPAKDGIAPRSPSSLGGTAALLANSRHLLARLSGTGPADLETVAARLAGSWYTCVLHQPGKAHDQVFQLKQLHPGPILVGDDTQRSAVGSYRPWTMQKGARYLVVVACVLLLAGLWVVFGIGRRRDGFEAMHDLFLLWTCLPTLVFVLVASFLSRLDIDTRRLAPFLKLATQKCRFQDALGLSYADESAPRTLWKALKHRDWDVFATKCLATLGWLLPIVAAGLFAHTRLEQVQQLQLQPETSFLPDSQTETGPDNELIDAVLLRDTPVYPAWTYEDLAFPELSLQDHDGPWQAGDTVLQATVPAVAASMACETDSLRAVDDLDCQPLESGFDATKCKDYAGFVASSCSTPATSSAPFVYVWGGCSGPVTVLSCRETLVEVPVRIVLRTEGLAMDAVPVPDRASYTPANLTLGVESAYDLLESKSDGAEASGLDGFFRTLVASRLKVPVARLGSEERTNAVAQAIQLQHGIVRAQTLNAARRPLSDTHERPAPIPASTRYFAQRLTPAPLQTGLLTGLVGLVLLVGGASLRGPEAPALPKDPGCIAARASLLADSTLWWRLPRGAEWLTDQQLARRLRRRTFTLAWSEGGAGGGGRSGLAGRSYGVAVVQDHGKVVRVELEGDCIYPGKD